MTIAMLSWGAHATLLNTLRSYKKYGLLDLDDEKIIWFQEESLADYKIARDYGFTPYGVPSNIGIGQAYRRLVELSTGDLFLFLENDWELIEEARAEILEAAEMLRANVVDLVKFRHRSNPGNPLWSRQFQDNELNRPEYLLESIHWTDPNRFLQIQKWDNWYVTTSSYANWSNNPHMARTKWLRENILPRVGTGDLEKDIQDWWRAQKFGVAQSEGLFTHNRL